MRDCATGQSPYGRRLQATEDSVNDGFYTTDGYTTLGNIAICSQEACCDGESGDAHRGVGWISLHLLEHRTISTCAVIAHTRSYSLSSSARRV